MRVYSFHPSLSPPSFFIAMRKAGAMKRGQCAPVSWNSSSIFKIMNIFLFGDIRFRYLRQIIAVLTAFHIKLTIYRPFHFCFISEFQAIQLVYFFLFSKIQNLHKLHQSFQVRQIIFNSLNIYLFITSHIYVTFTYLYKIVIFLLHSLKEINLKPNAVF